MSGASLGYNIAEDATGTWAAYTIMQAKSDGGATISEADTDDYPGAIWFNFVDDTLIQINEAFQGSQQVDAFDILGTLDVDGNVTFTAGNFEVTAGTTTLGGATSITGNTDITGTFDVTGAIAGSAGVTLAEQADGGNPGAGKGRVWVKNATPCELWFTDDTDADTQLGTGGATTHEMFFYQGYSASRGDYGTREIGPSGQENFIFAVPADFGSVANLELVVIPSGTDATWDIDLDSDYGAAGESYTTHSEADAASTYNLTQNQIAAIDISGVFTSLAAGDYCGLAVTNNDGSDTLYVVGIRLKYNLA